MTQYRTFRRGGIHPPDGKALTSHRPIQNAPVPALAVVPFSQHIGAPAVPLVSVGDRVEEGQLLGEPAGFVSAAVHSPIPGLVQEMKSLYLPSGVKTDAAVIALDGPFARTGKEIKRFDWSSLSVDSLLALMRDNGVVGQGGATFPSHVKFSVPKGRSCEVFIVNAAECEPYLSADHRVLMEKTEDFLEGVRILRKILAPERVIIGIEANKMDAVEKVSSLVGNDGIEVVALATKYPQGAEKNLIEALIGREVPSGKLPLEVGVINANVGTILSVRDAVVLHQPVVERVVTVSGGAITNPSNIRARIGTSIQDLIDECGGFSSEPVKIISGGPMMGFAFQDLDTPVTKGTSGILALTAREVKQWEPTACLSCGRCIQVCPMGLSPTRIYKLIEHGRLDEAAEAGMDDCVLCGSCAYGCPAHIPLVSAFRAGRGRRRRLVTKKG